MFSKMQKVGLFFLFVIFKLQNGQFQQEAHMSNFLDQRKARRAFSVHEGLAVGIINMKCRGRYTGSKFARKNR